MVARFFTILLLLFSSTSLADDGLHLNKLFGKAVVGDFVVSLQEHVYSLYNIFAKSDNFIILEQVSVPEALRKQQKMTWKEWLAMGAPGHHSWDMLEINLNDGKVREFYSFSRKGWMDVLQTENFLSSLLMLKLSLIPNSERRKIGFSNVGSEQHQPLWRPRLYVEGKLLDDINFSAYRAKWSKDGTELSGKELEIYIPEDSDLYPSYFPFWIQLQHGLGRVNLRVVDSGRDMVSPKKSLPRPSIRLEGQPHLADGFLSFYVKGRPYYHQYFLFASEIGRFFGKAISLPCHAKGSDKPDVLILQVKEDDLSELLQEGREYYFTVVEKDFSDIYVESSHPFAWPPFKEDSLIEELIKN